MHGPLSRSPLPRYGPPFISTFLASKSYSARHCTSSISLRKGLNGGVADLLRQYAKQLKEFELYETERDVDIASFTSFPCLETLIIGSPSGDNDLNILNLEHVMRLLHLAPNLVKCTFINIYVEIQDNPSHELVLPSLRCLNLAGLENRVVDEILPHLSLPALEVLAIPLYNLSLNEFSRFLKRSLPPLRNWPGVAEPSSSSSFSSRNGSVFCLPSPISSCTRQTAFLPTTCSPPSRIPRPIYSQTFGV